MTFYKVNVEYRRNADTVSVCWKWATSTDEPAQKGKQCNTHLKKEIQNTLLNALGFYAKKSFKLAVKYYGKASAYIELYEESYGVIPEYLAESYATLNELIDAVKVTL